MQPPLIAIINLLLSIPLLEEQSLLIILLLLLPFSLSPSLHQTTVPYLHFLCILNNKTLPTITQTDIAQNNFNWRGNFCPRDVMGGFMSGIQRKLSVVEPGVQKSVSSHSVAHRCSKAALMIHVHRLRLTSLHWPRTQRGLCLISNESTEANESMEESQYSHPLSTIHTYMHCTTEPCLLCAWWVREQKFQHFVARELATKVPETKVSSPSQSCVDFIGSPAINPLSSVYDSL